MGLPSQEVHGEYRQVDIFLDLWKNRSPMWQENMPVSPSLQPNASQEEVGRRLKVFNNITLEYDVEELMRFCHLEVFRDRIREVEAVIDESYRLVDPKAAYKTVKISEVKGNRLVLEEGSVFESELLAEKFKCTSEIAVYVATIGPALERRVTELGPRELSKSFMMDCIGTYALRQVCDIIQEDFQPGGGERLSKFSPGDTAYWDIRQQKVLFEVLGSQEVEDITGVRLNESYTMIPRKSVSGVIGDTEEQFLECQICKRRCEYRRAPFKG